MLDLSKTRIMEPPAGEPVDILLVEDNPGDARLVQEAFATSTFETAFHTVTDGNEAIDFLTTSTASSDVPFPDLLLLDLNLPRMDGFEVLETVRDHSDVSSLPIIVLTSSAAEEDILTSYELAANAYLTKPATPDEFDSLVSAVESFWFDAAQLPTISP